MSAAVLTTRVGWATWHEHATHGHRVFADLLGRESLGGLLALAASGRRVDAEAARVLDDIGAAFTAPDPRIWPTKVVRVLSAYGRMIPGFVAGALIFESKSVGPRTVGDSAAQLVAIDRIVGGAGTTCDREALRAAIREVRANVGRLAGYGVPFRPTDERMDALRARMIATGRASGRWWTLLERVIDVVREETGLEGNVGSGAAAAMLDLGLPVESTAPIAFALLGSVLLGNAVEGAKQAPEVLRKLPDDALDYRAAAPRVSPRARAATSPPGEDDVLRAERDGQRA